MKLDMHVHTTFSPDGRVEPREALRLAKAKKLDGLCMADHNTARAFNAVKDLAAGIGLLLVRGAEVSTSEGHILAYGVDQPIPRGLAPADTIEIIHDMGGVAVVAHPFRAVSGVGEKICRGLGPDALEVINARSGNRDNNKTKLLADSMKLPGIGGSDSHEPETIGMAWTVFSGSISSEEDVLEAIRHGEVMAGGRGMTFGELVGVRIGSSMKFAKRGFRKI